MSREEAITKLHEAAKHWDKEEAHGLADDALCDLLSALGYEDVVEAWKRVPKWYA
ncbi:hypothetical protein [Pantoea piersonii]|uniref:hypothetical protein n=1 Tax=Pantoea piersonii TaxID=2364647 RepID=UPI0028B19EC4|nr:hypothetical protein [Pantoea piersonii]